MEIVASNQSLFSSTRLLHLFENNLHEWIRVYYNILIEDFVGIYFYIQQNVYALCIEWNFSSFTLLCYYQLFELIKINISNNSITRFVIKSRSIWRVLPKTFTFRVVLRNFVQTMKKKEKKKKKNINFQSGGL